MEPVPEKTLTTADVGLPLKDDPCHNCATFGAGKICRASVGLICPNQCPLCKKSVGTAELATYADGQRRLWARKAVCKECQHEHGMDRLPLPPVL